MRQVRRRQLLIAAGTLLAMPLAVYAQQVRKIQRVGVIWPTTGTSFEEFRQAMREFGYIEGRNISFEYRGPGLSGLSEVAKELVASQVDAIVTFTPQATVAAKNATRTIPIVFLGIGDPVESGLVASLARPGGNLAGTSRMLTEMSIKHLEMLNEVVPSLGQVAIIWNPENSSHEPALKALRTVAQRLAIRLEAFEVRDRSALDGAFAAMSRGKSRGLVILADPAFLSLLGAIAKQAQVTKLPTIARYPELAEQGGFIGYTPVIADEVRRAAVLLNKILKGASPGDLPIEQPTRFELVINMKTARALGLSLPQSVLLRADRVIE